MTVLVLDRSTGPFPRYADWLGLRSDEVVVFTDRSSSDIPEVDAARYAEVRYLAKYETNTAVELALLDLAENDGLSALVATDNSDSIMCGALRDHLNLPGPGRQAALALTDLVTMRRHLESAGASTVPSGPVRAAADLHWYAHRWGYPLRVRKRRVTGWPMVAELDGERAVQDFSQGAFVPDLRWIPDLVAEKPVQGQRHRLVPGESAGIAASALTAIPELARLPQVIDVIRTGSQDLVDSITIDEAGNLRTRVRAQAGLPVTEGEVPR